jgi:hypothetical protein
MRKYSHSALKVFQRCQKKWSYIYIDKIVPKEVAKYFERGSNLHEHLAIFYSDTYEGPIPDLSDRDAELLTRYFKKWGKEDEKWKVLSVEEDYEFEVGGFQVVFKPDLVVEINDEAWIVDHKTTASIPDEWDPYNMSDFQHLLYVAGMRNAGYNIKGFIFNYISTKAPKQPYLVKDGSRIAYLAQLATDYDTLWDFAVKNRMSEDPDVQEKLAIIRGAPDRFFQRHYLMVPDKAIDNALSDVSDVLYNMHEAEEYEYYPRHVVAGYGGSMACSKCPYQPICHAELLGIDTKELLLTMYKRKEKRNA